MFTPRLARPLAFALVAACFGGSALCAAHAPSEAEQLFVRKIHPLLKNKCLSCHGDDERKLKGGLDLRTHAKLLQGGASEAPAVVPGKPEESPIYLAATRTHDLWEPMPPKENDRLSEEDVGYLKQWIAEGAPWPEEAVAREIAKLPDKWTTASGVTVKTSGGLSEDWTHRRYKPTDLWSYQPLK